MTREQLAQVLAFADQLAHELDQDGLDVSLAVAANVLAANAADVAEMRREVMDQRPYVSDETLAEYAHAAASLSETARAFRVAFPNALDEIEAGSAPTQEEQK